MSEAAKLAPQVEYNLYVTNGYSPARIVARLRCGGEIRNKTSTQRCFIEEVSDVMALRPLKRVADLRCGGY